MRNRIGIALTGMLAASLALAPAAMAKGTVYSTGNSNELQAKPIAADGSLGAATVTPTGAVTPRGIAITPDARHLYMTSAGANVLGFSIGGATVAPVPGSPYNVTDTGGYGLAISPGGQFLYTLNQNGGAGSVSIFAINNGDGALTKVGANVPLGYQGDGVAISPNGSNLYITDTTNGTVHAYAIAADGTITQIGAPQATGANPKGIAIGPLGQHVYTASTGGLVSSFPIGADGTLSAAGSTVNTAPLSPQTLGVTQNGQFLYAANFNAAGSVSGLAIGAGGALSTVPGSPFPAQTFTYGLDAAPGGRTVYSTSFDAAVDVPMNGFAVGADGALSPLPGSPYPTQIFGSEFQSVVTTPNQGPTALFTAFAPGAGEPSQFNATSSNDGDGGTIARYDWDFGDGTTLADGGPSPTHVYAQAGNFQVTLTVTDDEGCSNQVLFTGQTVDCNGSGTARISQEVQVAGGTAPNLKLKGKKQKLKKKVTVTAKTADDDRRGRQRQAQGCEEERQLEELHPQEGREVAFREREDQPEAEARQGVQEGQEGAEEGRQGDREGEGEGHRRERRHRDRQRQGEAQEEVANLKGARPLDGSLTKEVLRGRPLQRGRAGAVSRGDEAVEAADQRRGQARVLVADEVRCGRGLIGDRDHRRPERAAAAVGPPAPVVERDEPGAADRDVGLAMSPGPAEAVGDDDRGPGAGGGLDLRAQPPRRGIRVLGQETANRPPRRRSRNRSRRWRRSSRRWSR